MKFFIALAFALAVCGFASAQGFDGGVTPIQYDPNNQTLLTVYNFGFDSAQIHAVSSGEDPNADWVADKVNSLTYFAVNGISYYQFNVTIVQGAKGPGTLYFTVNTPPLNLVEWQVL